MIMSVIVTLSAVMQLDRHYAPRLYICGAWAGQGGTALVNLFPSWVHEVA
jgi:hypothetical protein